MPRTIKATVYLFDELSDEAKEKARDWFKSEAEFDHEVVFEDAKECGKLLGIKIDNIYFRGFSYQGDGACFEGSYAYRKNSTKAIRDHAPLDLELHYIADELFNIQKSHFFSVTAKVKHRGSHYYHENTTYIEVQSRRSSFDENLEDGLSEILRDFMKWIYKQLEASFWAEQEDDYVDESIRANEYEFYVDGTQINSGVLCTL